MENGDGLFEKIRAASSSRWVASLAAGVALNGCIGVAGDRASLAAPVDGLIAALTRADGDRATIDTTPEPDGRTKVVVRGEHHDGRPFLRALFAGLTANEPTSSAFDVDLDVKVATLTGFNGEALHDASLRLSGKGGEILEFALAGKLGLADLRGDLRTGREGRRMVYVETGDAGAFFRFINVYPRAEKGRAWIAMDAPTPDHTPQDGVVDVHDLDLLGTQILKPFMPKTKPGPDEILRLSHLRFGFKLSPDQVLVNDGIAVNRFFGATADGKINFMKHDVKIRGTVIPIFGSDLRILPPAPPLAPEGLFSLGYEIVGPIGAPILRINPAGPLAPGLLRKFLVPSSDEM